MPEPTAIKPLTPTAKVLLRMFEEGAYAASPYPFQVDTRPGRKIIVFDKEDRFLKRTTIVPIAELYNRDLLQFENEIPSDFDKLMLAKPGVRDHVRKLQAEQSRRRENERRAEQRHQERQRETMEQTSRCAGKGLSQFAQCW